MYFNFSVRIPQNTGRVTMNRKGETTYIEYTYDRVYDPQRQFNIPKRTTIGKQCEDDADMMYPNPNFLKYFPDAEIPEISSDTERSSCLHIGTFLVIKKIIEEYRLPEMLLNIIGKDSGLFLDLAAYSIISENNAAQHYPSYTYHHPLMTENMRMYSDAKVSEFFHDLGREQSIAFLNEWNESRDHRERIYISYDSTNKACQAGDIEIAEFGHSKDGQNYPIFNYSIAYDRSNREPLFYEEYPGSIVDVSQLQFMLEKAKGYGYRKVGFILDRGYFSKENIRYMDQCGYDFIIMMKGMKKLVSNLVIEVSGTFEETRKNSIREYQVNGITVERKLFPSDTKDRYFHIYYSGKLHLLERRRLEDHIDHMTKYLDRQRGRVTEIDHSFEKYYDLIYYHQGEEDQTFTAAREKTDVIDREIRLCGYFVIITSKKMTAKEALLLYKSRDATEKLFCADKSFLNNRSLRVQSEESLDGKIFVEFVALIIRNKMYTCLKQEMDEDESRQSYMTVPAAIRELEKIEMVRQGGRIYRLDHALTKTQKHILQSFGIDTAYVKKEAARISEILAEIEESMKVGKTKKGNGT